MALLRWLEGVRFSPLTEFMLLITHMGEETAFLVVAIVLFWCVNKKLGYYVMSVGFVGTTINQFLKMTYRVARPFELDTSFHAVKGALREATGFSFPSGHTQASVGTFGSIAFATSKRWVRILCLSLALLVPFSRLYLGVHTPLDVAVSFGVAVLLIILLYPFIYGGRSGKRMYALLGGMLLLSFTYLLYVNMYQFPVNIDSRRLASGIESSYTLLGALLGMLVVYIVDSGWLHFPVEAKWYMQIVKVIVGLALVLAVKAGLKTPLNALLGEPVGRMLRYFLVVFTAGVIWPMSFSWFSKVGVKE